MRRLNLTAAEQGERWQQAGGKLSQCWYAAGSAEAAGFRRGFLAAVEKQAAIKTARPIEERPSDR